MERLNDWDANRVAELSNLMAEEIDNREDIADSLFQLVQKKTIGAYRSNLSGAPTMKRIMREFTNNVCGTLTKLQVLVDALKKLELNRSLAFVYTHAKTEFPQDKPFEISIPSPVSADSQLLAEIKKLREENEKLHKLIDNMSKENSDLMEENAELKKSKENKSIPVVLPILENTLNQPKYLSDIPTNELHDIAYQIGLNWADVGVYFCDPDGNAYSRSYMIARHGYLVPNQYAIALMETLAKRGITIRFFAGILQKPQVGLNFIVSDLIEKYKL